MLRIGICDQDREYRRRTADIWFHVYFDAEDVGFTFYETGKALAEELSKGKLEQDLLIIDPVLADMSGLHILEFIRKQRMNTDIILQTEAADLALYGYRYRVFDFLKKPVSVREAERVAVRYMIERSQEDEEFLSVSIQGNSRKLRLSKISFFESNVRKIVAVMERESVEFYQKMNELEQKLPEGEFLRCHQSYIVNRSYILGMAGEEIVLLNQKKIPVSRRYMKDVCEFFEERGEEGNGK
ncbi:MAG: response regulator transcription factor [Clostridiales bacterium]|nr:response regulator transcription factor [Clostridiales bacterium]